MKNYNRLISIVRNLSVVILFSMFVSGCESENELVPLEDTNTSYNSPLPESLSDLERDEIKKQIEEYNHSIK